MRTSTIFLCLFFITITTAVAQSYQVQYTWSDITYDDGGGEERLIVSDGNNTSTLYLASCGLGNSCADVSGTRNVPFKPTSVYLRASGSPTGTTAITYTNDIACDSGSYNLTTHNSTTSRVTLKIAPNITVNSSPSVGTLGICEDISLTATSGFSPDLYVWEYNYDIEGDGPLRPTQSEYKEIPGKSGRPNISVSASDIPDVPEQTVFRIRLRYCPGGSFGGISYGTTTARSFDYIKCSPKVINVDTIKPTCAYKTDGSAQFFFDRPLEDGEVLNGVTIFERLENNMLGASYYLGSNNRIDQLDDNNSFSWPRQLKSGEYFLQYQSDTNGTFEYSPDFTIGLTPSFSFTITADPILCSNGSTNIEINASGGTTPYFYKIGTNDPVQFTNSSTTTINVMNANYELRVFDNEGCFQKLN